MTGSLDADPSSQANEWAQTFARQCRDTLDELAFLAPWTLLPTTTWDSQSEFGGLDEIPTLRELAGGERQWLPAIEDRFNSAATPEENERLTELRRLITQSSRRAKSRMEAIEELARQSGQLADMEYHFLYDKARHLLAIGYNVGERRRDSSYYDLLASEA
jgi:hypothetical protein